MTETTPRTPPLSAREGLEKLAGYPFQILTFVGPDGYPVSVAVDRDDRPGRRHCDVRHAGRPVGPDRYRHQPHGLPHPAAARLRLRRAASRHGLGPGDGRRRWRDPHLGGDAGLGLGRGRGRRSSSTRSGRPASRGSYFDALSVERGTPVKPRLLVRLARPPDDAPAVPQRDDRAGPARHRHRRAPGLVRSADRGPDRHRRVVRPARAQRRERRLRHAPRAPTTRTSRRPSSPAARGSSSTASCRSARWPALATAFYVAAGVDRAAFCSPCAARRRCSSIGVVGFVVSIGYTAPPLKFVYRGLGEIAVAIGFGPLMLLGRVRRPDARALDLGAGGRVAARSRCSSR